MKKLKLLTLFTLLSVVSCQTSHTSLNETPLVFLTVNNQGLTEAALKSKHSEQSLKVYETHLKADTTFKGYSLIELLDTYYGSNWKNHDGILFTALDGYRSDVSVAKILKYKPLLAYSYSDKTANFVFDNKAQNEKDVELGPFYLVWDNIKNPELLRQGAHGWPYQVVKLETIMYADYYAKAFPIKKPTESQRKGFELFKNYCMSCHSVSGEEGGVKGPVLYPNPTVISQGYKSFRKWVQSPSTVKPGTTMPPLNPSLNAKEKEEVTRQIYSYLTALNKK